ncbi:MAG: hypothetical protein WCH04_21445 [Gammaproteobacteria bacterium]
MSGSRLLLGMLGGLILLTGCQSRGELLAGEEGIATQMAVHRGQSELGCEQATGTVLSSNILQAVPWGDQAQAEYTIDVSGCDKRSVYVVICPLGLSGCFVDAAHDKSQITQ